MKQQNQSSVTEFILLGLTDDRRMQCPLFIIFFVFYVITILGNISIMTIIWISPRLQSPMYFLLSHLAFADLCYSSVITPNMLANLVSDKKSISLPGCIAQLFLFQFFGSTDVCLLVAMAYDRYVAICRPLLYTAIITKDVCIYLSVGSYSVALLNAAIHTGFTFRLSFCGPNKINHFYCDIPPLLKLSCSDTSLNEAILFFVAGIFAFTSFILIFISYIHIVSATLRIRSSEGRSRAFSTCSSHFFCVFLFYGTVTFMYLRPNSSHTRDQDRVASVFYTVVIPMLNPLIYSLRNQQVKSALQNIVDSKSR